jgi:RNA polymerase sigma-70 factor (ECF subfamily)
MIDVDDVELLRRARKGDESSFSELFARHQQAIYRYGSYMCGPDAADDIVQETFLAVLRQAARHDLPQGAVIGYLMGIARHRIQKRLTLKGEQMLEQPIDAHICDIQAEWTTPVDRLAAAETTQQVRSAVDSLPAVYREAVVLCELQELDYAVAADLAQCPVGTIRSRLHRAKQLLAAKLRATQPVGSER